MFESIRKLFSRKDEPAEGTEIDFIPPEEEVESQESDIYEEVASLLEIEPELLRAFVKVEAGSKNDLDGRVIIRWETHIFERYTGVTVRVHGKRGRITKECQDNEYEAFNRAAKLVEDGKYEKKAYMSASYGLPQIMGFHYKRLRFGSPQKLKEYIGSSEENAIRAMGKFIMTDSRLLGACRDKNYHLIATYYNGAGYKNYAINGVTYADRIQSEYERIKPPEGSGGVDVSI